MYASVICTIISVGISDSLKPPKRDANMRRDETLKILSEHKDDLREKFGVTSIAIFGSTARDEARPDSDVDTLIEIERPAGFFEVARVKFYLEDLLDTKVDLATPGALRAPIRERIYQDLIYVR